MSESTMSQRIRQIRTEAGMTMKEFGKAIGVGESSVANYEAGFRRPKKQDVLDAIADIGNCSMEWLMGKSDVRNNTDYASVYDAGVTAGLKTKIDKWHEIPVFSALSCGTGINVADIPDEYIGMPAAMISRDLTYFCNPAEGDSMVGAGINPGDYLIFEQADEIPSGKIGSFSLNGEYYCKRFKQYADGSCWLFSENDEYPPIPIHPNDNFRVLGLYRFKLSKEQ